MVYVISWYLQVLAYSLTKSILHFPPIFPFFLKLLHGTSIRKVGDKVKLTANRQMVMIFYNAGHLIHSNYINMCFQILKTKFKLKREQIILVSELSVCRTHLLS